MPGFEIFGDQEKKEVMDVLDTGVLFRYGFDNARKGHWKAKTLEQKLCEKTNAKYAHLCSSGTAALSIALAACGIGAGDEVIVPPLTFVATFEAVINIGAIPVFSEIDETLCLDPDKLINVVTSKTKAVIPVHMCGAMAHIDKIKDFCSKKGLILIEDACQAVGGTFKGKSLGTFGDIGCFSFDAVKTITCGEGGAIITDSRELYEKADQYADHGHDHVGGADRGADDHPILGMNYRISELNAAVGVAQINKLDKIIKIQKKNKQIIKHEIAKFPEISFRKIPDENGDTATFLSFFLENKERAKHVAAKFAENGVTGAPYWFDNKWHYFKQWHHLKQLNAASRLPLELFNNTPDYNNVSLPQSDEIMKKTISMQIMLSWKDNEIKDRINRIKKVLKG